MQIRTAIPADAPAVSMLTEARRRAYENFQPRFWRRAPDSAAVHRLFLQEMLADPNVLGLVAENDQQVIAFLAGRMVDAPAVYDPGGSTLAIDDFVVAEPALWDTIGRELLKHAASEGVRLGAVQVVVVCGALDDPKRAALDASGLTIASEWWVADAPSLADP